ncbi:MAG TPA: HesA/MoeB/ThiF family protein [Candidatus Methanomethylophilaceae archaeon]|nr:HesA/MoeB/ThiF family protein [Candidatus Methanomethylophilaceae archaeon]
MRHSRQAGLFGPAGQLKLKESKVSIVGCGGLGTYVAVLLTSAGVGSIKLIDGDTPSESDFNRQFMYPGEEGLKADILGEKLRKIDHGVRVETFCEYIDEENVSDAIDGCDVIADCLDSVKARLILNKHSISENIPLAHGGIDGFHGQATFLIPGRTPCLGCILRPSENDVPLSFSPMASMVASLQASDIIKFLTGTGETLAGKLMTISIDTNSYHIIDIRPDPRCPVCGVDSL